MKKIRNQDLYFKTYDEYDKYCEGKDIQFCNVTIDEKMSEEDFCKRYNALSVNTTTGKMINYLN